MNREWHGWLECRGRKSRTTPYLEPMKPRSCRCRLGRISAGTQVCLRDRWGVSLPRDRLVVCPNSQSNHMRENMQLVLRLMVRTIWAWTKNCVLIRKKVLFDQGNLETSPGSPHRGLLPWPPSIRLIRLELVDSFFEGFLRVISRRMSLNF